MSSFFEMGGYGGFVWPAYAVTVIVMAALLVASLYTLRRREAELRILQQTVPSRAARRAARVEVAGDA